jgi:hypothetical protein
MPLADRSDTERAPAPQFNGKRGSLPPDHPGPFAPVSEPAFSGVEARTYRGRNGPGLGIAPSPYMSGEI